MNLLAFLINQDYFPPPPRRAVLPLPASLRWHLMLLGRPVPTPVRQRVLDYAAGLPAPDHLSEHKLTNLMIFLGNDNNSPSESAHQLGVLSGWFSTAPQLAPRLARLALRHGQSIFLLHLADALVKALPGLGYPGQVPAAQVAGILVEYVRKIRARMVREGKANQQSALNGTGSAVVGMPYDYMVWFVLGGAPLVHAFVRLLRGLDEPQQDPLPSLALEVINSIEQTEAPYMRSLLQDKEWMLAYTNSWKLRQISGQLAPASSNRPLM